MEDAFYGHRRRMDDTVKPIAIIDPITVQDVQGTNFERGCQTEQAEQLKESTRPISSGVEVGCQTERHRSSSSRRRSEDSSSSRRKLITASIRHNPDAKDFFCCDCRTYVCYFCIINHHVEHNTINARDQEVTQDEEITKLVTKANKTKDWMISFGKFIEERKTSTAEITQKSIVMVDEDFREKMQILEQERKSRIKFYQQREQAINEMLEGRKTDNDAQISIVDTVLDSVQKAKGVRLSGGELTAHEMCCKQFEEMLENCKIGESEECKVQKDTAVPRFKRKSIRGITELDLVESDDPWILMHDVPLIKDGMKTMATMQDGRIAVGFRKAGVAICNSDGHQQMTNLHGVTIQDMAVMTESRFAILDKKNHLSIYMLLELKLEKMDVKPFRTLNKEKGGDGTVAVNGYDHIFIGYTKAMKIQEFAPEGGKALRELECTDHLPIQLFHLKVDKLLVVKGRADFILTLDMTEEIGQPKKSLKKDGDMCAYPAVCLDQTLIVAWVSNRENYVTIDRYTRELTHIETLISEHKLPKQETNYNFPDHLQQFLSGEIAFCSQDRLYIFAQNTLAT
ncbi:uncharacterized protein LOC121424197 [Lytechinus variegatus]|uniref:uncharacterized protein LOC121424197 n=1 Tax=Lytechinus variegatus TaxID=7654 RepID=UPI001BB1C3B2|nr:uncharacterized protein LOC121424197 [Lytechinus variegatus]